jgi:acetyl-CoA acetyltransferase family protein
MWVPKGQAARSKDDGAMKQTCQDLLDEYRELDALCATLSATQWHQRGPFHGWSAWDEVAHLCYFDETALQAVRAAGDDSARIADKLRGLLSMNARINSLELCVQSMGSILFHAGNSSGIVDGSAAVLIGTKEAGEKYGLKARARIVSMASVGSEPSIMLTGPEFAAQKALARAGMDKNDIDVWELNEAFASVVLRFMEAMHIDHSDINVNGGAIAMGHPLGATGAMILGTVLDELERSGKSTALTTLCIGAGMGTATIIERVN